MASADDQEKVQTAVPMQSYSTLDPIVGFVLTIMTFLVWRLNDPLNHAAMGALKHDLSSIY